MIHFFTFGNAANLFALKEQTAGEQGPFAASANAKPCTNISHQTLASFSHAAFAFCSHSNVNPALQYTLAFASRYTFALAARKTVEK